MSESIPTHLQALYDELDAKIEEYLRAWWKENEVAESGDYIANWVLVANFGNINETAASGYIIESQPSNMPPHAIKGLLMEGVEWVCEMQEKAKD